MELGSRTKSYWLEQREPIVSERVLSKAHHDDFANNYFRVLRGDLGDWGWKKEYGQEVIDFIRTASAPPHNVSQCLSNSRPNTSFTSPFDIPPLQGLEETYSMQHQLDRELLD